MMSSLGLLSTRAKAAPISAFAWWKRGYIQRTGSKPQYHGHRCQIIKSTIND